jgi:tetratricopeptide (TPR) repeat protein
MWRWLFQGWGVAIGKEALLTLLCLWVFWVQLTYRVPSTWLFVLLPWVTYALLIIRCLGLAAVLLGGGALPHPLNQLQRIAGWLVQVFAIYSVALVINAKFDQSIPVDQRSKVLQAWSAELDLGRVVPLAAIGLESWRHPGQVERLLVWEKERRRFWPGQPIVLQMRKGALGLPWVFRIERDEVEHARQVLKAIPTASEPWKNLVNFSLDHQQWEEAFTAAQAYLQLYPHDYDFAESTAAVFGQARRHREVVELMRPFLKSHPTYDAYNFVGFALGHLGRRDEGIALIRQSIPLDPESFWAYYHLGYLYRWSGQRAEAAAMFEEVLKRRPNFPEIQAQLTELRDGR